MHIGIKIFPIISVPALIFVMKWFQGDFTVTVHVAPTVVLVGQAVTLSCHLIGKVPANIQVHWYKLERNKNTTLYFYKSTEKGTGLGLPGDLHRIKGRYENGVVKVNLFPVQVEDSGQYVCAVTSDGVYQEAIAQVTVPGDFKKGIKEFQDQMGDMEKRIKELQEQVGDFKKRIKEPQEQMGDVEQIIRDFKKRINELQEQMGDFKKRINELQEQMEEPQEQMGDVEQIIRDLEKTINELQEQMDELQDQKDQLREDIRILIYLLLAIAVTLIPFLEKCKRDLEERIKELQEQMDQLREDIRALISLWKYISMTVIPFLGKWKKELQEQMGVRGKKIKELQEKIDQLREDIRALICLLLSIAVTLISFLGKWKKELQEKMGDLEKRMRDLSKTLRDLEKTLKELQEQVDQPSEDEGALNNLLLSIAVTLIPFLEKWKRDLEKTLKDLEKTLKELQEQVGALNYLLLSIAVTLIPFLEKCKRDLEKTKRDSEKTLNELQEQMDQLREDKSALICLLLSIAVTLIPFLEKCKRDLEKRIKEPQEQMDEMKKVLEWRMVRNSSDDITLDAVTAHPNLSIAEEQKSFKHEAQPQKVQPTPERFDSTVCVLGSEGFSSGKHYWEVDIGSCTDWDLGVARKSIQRKGKLSLSPKEGFWALGQSGRDYWAKTDPWTQVTVQKKPKKIGVYLSYQEGQVTFLSVPDMSVLFTFNDCSFSGEVYPFFKNSHKETTMRICSIKEE